MTNPIFSCGRKIALHVGCGTEDRSLMPDLDFKAEWREVRVDIDPSVNPDVVASILDLQGVPDASASMVFSKHNIEHVESHQVALVLASFYRVLKPEGFLILRTPDLEQVARLVLDKGLEKPVLTVWGQPTAAIDILYGHRGKIAEGNSFMAHRTGFTKDTLRAHLAAAGFGYIRVEQRPQFELGAIAAKSADGGLLPALFGARAQADAAAASA